MQGVDVCFITFAALGFWFIHAYTLNVTCSSVVKDMDTKVLLIWLLFLWIACYFISSQCGEAFCRLERCSNVLASPPSHLPLCVLNVCLYICVCVCVNAQTHRSVVIALFLGIRGREHWLHLTQRCTKLVPKPTVSWTSQASGGWEETYVKV